MSLFFIKIAHIHVYIYIHYFFCFSLQRIVILTNNGFCINYLCFTFFGAPKYCKYVECFRIMVSLFLISFNSFLFTFLFSLLSLNSLILYVFFQALIASSIILWWSATHFSFPVFLSGQFFSTWFNFFEALCYFGSLLPPVILPPVRYFMF